jgi:SH3-like domain-containing protein
MRRLCAWPIILQALLLLVAGHLNPAAAAAQAGQEAGSVRLDTPSGYPVPRFVSLKATRTNCRNGPSFAHPVAITYIRAGTPVLVVAETLDHWRKIRDIDGAECWVHRTTLRAVTHVIIVDAANILIRPETGAPTRAHFGTGVLARVERVDGEWVRVSAGGERGWAPRTVMWGVGDIAPHN